MKLLIDEMWPPDVAIQLRKRGYDVDAVVERADLRGQPDNVIFAVAQQEARAAVTENVGDFLPLATALVQQGLTHSSLSLTSDRRFPRHDARTLGRLISALDEVLLRDPDGRGLELWLS